MTKVGERGQFICTSYQVRQKGYGGGQVVFEDNILNQSLVRTWPFSLVSAMQSGLHQRMDMWVATVTTATSATLVSYSQHDNHSHLPSRDPALVLAQDQSSIPKFKRRKIETWEKASVPLQTYASCDLRFSLSFTSLSSFARTALLESFS